MILCVGGGYTSHLYHDTVCVGRGVVIMLTCPPPTHDLINSDLQLLLSINLPSHFHHMLPQRIFHVSENKFKVSFIRRLCIRKFKIQLERSLLELWAFLFIMKRSIEKMNKIRQFNKENQTIIVESGVILSQIHDIVEKENLFLWIIIAKSSNSSMMIKMVVSQKCRRRSEFLILKGNVLRSLELKKCLVCAVVITFYSRRSNFIGVWTKIIRGEVGLGKLHWR